MAQIFYIRITSSEITIFNLENSGKKTPQKATLSLPSKSSRCIKPEDELACNITRIWQREHIEKA